MNRCINFLILCCVGLETTLNSKYERTMNMIKKSIIIMLVAVLAFSIMSSGCYAQSNLLYDRSSKSVDAAIVNTQKLSQYGINIHDGSLSYSIEPITIKPTSGNTGSGFALRVHSEAKSDNSTIEYSDVFITDIITSTSTYEYEAIVPNDLLNVPIFRATDSNTYFTVTYYPTHTTHEVPSIYDGKAFRPTRMSASYSVRSSGATVSKLYAWLHISGDLVKFPYEVIQDVDEWGFEFTKISPAPGVTYSKSQTLPSGQYFHVFSGMYAYTAGANITFTTQTGKSDVLELSSVIYSY